MNQHVVPGIAPIGKYDLNGTNGEVRIITPADPAKIAAYRAAEKLRRKPFKNGKRK